MAEDIKGTPVAVAEKPKTEAELMADMMAAVKSGDYKAVAKVASELVKFQKAKEQAELEAKQKVLAEKTIKIKAAIDKAVEKLIQSGELDAADGIWYTNDFGEKLVTCRLIKVMTKTKTTTGGGGGGGKKFSVSTTELLEKFGSQEYKDGQTFQAAWDANTDKNWRYAIREALLKKDGLIS
jgi:hypothetical protein